MRRQRRRPPRRGHGGARATVPSEAEAEADRPRRVAKEDNNPPTWSSKICSSKPPKKTNLLAAVLLRDYQITNLMTFLRFLDNPLKHNGPPLWPKGPP